MKRNVGKVDSWIRVIIGVGIIAVGIYFSSWWGLIGVLPLLTGIFGRCLLYKPFGINTCGRKEEG